MSESPSLNDNQSGESEQDDLEPKTNPTQKPPTWFEIWRMVTLNPSIKNYKEILNDPKAGAFWGIFWMGVSAIVIWFAGPNRVYLSGLVADYFGRNAVSIFLLVGALFAPILGIILLLIQAVLSRGLARLFGGSGKLDQLVYCWGVTHMPFSLVIGFVNSVGYVFPISRGFSFSTIGLLIQLTTFVLLAAIYLFLLYDVAVGFAAVENISFWKGLGLFITQGFILFLATLCLASITLLLS